MNIQNDTHLVFINKRASFAEFMIVTTKKVEVLLVHHFRKLYRQKLIFKVFNWAIKDLFILM